MVGSDTWYACTNHNGDVAESETQEMLSYQKLTLLTLSVISYLENLHPKVLKVPVTFV